jgi:hypothetical protein
MAKLLTLLLCTGKRIVDVDYTFLLAFYLTISESGCSNPLSYL